MQEQLRLLKELQVIDTQIREIELAKGDLPRRQEELKSARNRDRADVESNKGAIKRNEEERARLEKEIAWDKEALGSFEERTKSLTSADAVSAQAKELDTRRKSIKEKEEAVLKLLEEREVLSKKATQLEVDFSAVEKGYAEREKEIEKTNAEIDGKTAALRAQRAEMAKGIERGLLVRYDQVFKRREGKAIVGVKAEVCQGCDMGVPPQIVNFSRSGEMGVQTCPHCARILFWEPSEARPSEKPKAKRAPRKKKDAAAEPEPDDGDDAGAEKH